MDRADGWVAIYRSLQNHWLWQDKPYTMGQAWLDLVLLANHQMKKVKTRTGFVEVERGQLFRSERTLAARWGWSQKKVHNFLIKLKQDGMVSFAVKYSVTQKSTEGSIITLINYRLHQDLRISEGINQGINGEAAEKQPGSSGEAKQQCNNGTKGQGGEDNFAPTKGDQNSDDGRNRETLDVFGSFIP